MRNVRCVCKNHNILDAGQVCKVDPDRKRPDHTTTSTVTVGILTHKEAQTIVDCAPTTRNDDYHSSSLGVKRWPT